MPAASRPHPVGRRTVAMSAKTGAIALAIVVAGVYGTVASFAETIARHNPVLAHWLVPGNGLIAARLAATLSGSDATAQDRQRADRLARQALRREPLALAALSTLGVNAQVRGDTNAARRFFDSAERLSRRELQTQLWLIEDAVSRNDVDQTLHHYDVALRTKPDAAELLFPVLAVASIDPEIQPDLINRLSRNPPWAEGFYNFIAERGSDVRATSSLFRALDRRGVRLPSNAVAGVVGRLIDAGMFDDAWVYYETLRPGADRRSSRDPRFTFDRTPSVLDWVPINDHGVSASIQSKADGGSVEFAASSGVDGPVLQQLQLLPPGTYRITGRSAMVDQPRDTVPYWSLRCWRGQELGRVPLPAALQGSGKFVGSFTVPQRCPAQMLMLVLPPVDAISGISGRIDQAQLAPVG